jgi:REP element-mobilizing transposase RayT
LIGAFKTISTKRINNVRKAPASKLWQRNYYEHILRNEKELNRIRQYIADNPANWQTDEENSNV